ncbi:hypothetical protein SKAU_G00038210 [Synaphobranchus kaupii]|uniref:Uncharacterized protein n=1 Tax=Synaphobranchus kaupii TaxID=118154 RepID=A0A9Q1GGN2_SYNKA|nr:hypothetical protein SKAU_G00038210 [Synaphobranchus kaupii]
MEPRHELKSHDQRPSIYKDNECVISTKLLKSVILLTTVHFYNRTLSKSGNHLDNKVRVTVFPGSSAASQRKLVPPPPLTTESLSD